MEAAGAMGMSYVVTEYRDLAWAMTQFALDNPEREQRAAMARAQRSPVLLPVGDGRGAADGRAGLRPADAGERAGARGLPSRGCRGVHAASLVPCEGIQEGLNGWMQGHRPVRIDAVECTHAVGSQPTVPDGATER